MAKRTPSLLLWLALASASSLLAGDPIVLAVSIDGLRPDAWQQAVTPNLDRMAEAGSYTLEGTTSERPKTLPSHSSMLTGVQPSRHKVKRNWWIPGMPKLRFPTVLRWVRQAGIGTTIVAAKSKFGIFNLSADVERFVVPEHELGSFAAASLVVDQTNAFLDEGHRGFYFVHLREVDSVGHSKGWMSPEQIAAVELVDQQLGRLIDHVASTGLAGDTSWILTADHGGHGLGHGDDIPEDMTVPFVMAGRGVIVGGELPGNVRVLDLAPTAAALLGVEPPEGLGGRVVTEGLENPL